MDVVVSRVVPDALHPRGDEAHQPEEGSIVGREHKTAVHTQGACLRVELNRKGVASGAEVLESVLAIVPPTSDRPVAAHRGNLVMPPISGACTKNERGYSWGGKQGKDPQTTHIQSDSVAPQTEQKTSLRSGSWE